MVKIEQFACFFSYKARKLQKELNIIPFWLYSSICHYSSILCLLSLVLLLTECSMFSGWTESCIHVYRLNWVRHPCLQVELGPVSMPTGWTETGIHVYRLNWVLHPCLQVELSPASMSTGWPGSCIHVYRLNWVLNPCLQVELSPVSMATGWT